MDKTYMIQVRDCFDGAVYAFTCNAKEARDYIKTNEIAQIGDITLYDVSDFRKVKEINYLDFVEAEEADNRFVMHVTD